MQSRLGQRPPEWPCPTPTWFLAFAIPALTEYLAEWLAYWRKQGAF